MQGCFCAPDLYVMEASYQGKPHSSDLKRCSSSHLILEAAIFSILVSVPYLSLEGQIEPMGLHIHNFNARIAI